MPTKGILNKLQTVGKSNVLTTCLFQFDLYNLIYFINVDPKSCNDNY